MRIKTIVLAGLLFIILHTPTQARVIYVDDDANGVNDGSPAVPAASRGRSWQNAYTYLQDALTDAKNAAKPVEIRVAQGTYKPDKGVGQTDGDREATFQLMNNVTLSGGYAGILETDPNERNIEKYTTILSGDLESNDLPLPLEMFLECFSDHFIILKTGCEIYDFNGDNYIDESDLAALIEANNYNENSYHVVTGSSTDSNAVIDGFTITSGNAEPYFPDEPLPYEPMGGGMYNLLGSPKVLNCTFYSNIAGNGGGMYNTNSNPKLFNCTFYNNIARNIVLYTYDMGVIYYGLGGALYNSGSSLELMDCRFTGNSAYSGGGIYNQAKFPVLTNCIFENNNAQNSGGGISNKQKSKPILKNCLFLENKAKEGAGIENNRSDPILTECTFNRNTAKISGGGIANYYSNPVLFGCKLIANMVSYYGGGIYCYNSGLSLINCTVSGNKSNQEGGGIYLFHGYSGIINNCIIYENTALSGSEIFTSYFPSHANPPVKIYQISNSVIGNEPNAIDGYLPLLIGDWIQIDPLFANPGYWDSNGTPNDVNDDFWVVGDYHLKSKAGRFDPNSQTLVQDDVTSPCIDAGDPNSPIGLEPFPNGGYINMGAYGGTSEASKSYFGKPVCETIVAGDINGDCKVDEIDLEILMLHWLEEN